MTNSTKSMTSILKSLTFTYKNTSRLKVRRQLICWKLEVQFFYSKLKTNAMEKDKREGLGDQVEDLIKAIVPKLARRYKDCPSCKKRKEWLNNHNGIFK